MGALRSPEESKWAFVVKTCKTKKTKVFDGFWDQETNLEKPKMKFKKTSTNTK